MCQVTCNQGGINAPARPESKPFPAILSLQAQMESREKKMGAGEWGHQAKTGRLRWNNDNCLNRVSAKVGGLPRVPSLQRSVCQSGHRQQSVCQLEILLEAQQGSGFGHQQYKLSVSPLILSLASLPQIPPVSHQGHCDLILSYLSSSAKPFFFFFFCLSCLKILQR